MANRVTVDCVALGQPDLATLDALLRLRLTLKRAGCNLVIENCGPCLRELISLVGVQDLLASVDAGREAEERE
jgi:ABC-type transporter Mla MlaB component